MGISSGCFTERFTMSSTCRPSFLRLDWRPATRMAEGPMSTPRRLWPRSMGTPMMRTFWAMRSSVNRDSRESSAVPRRTEEPGKSLINSRLQEQREKRRLPALRIHAINHAREGDDLANVLGAANPGDSALKAHSEAGVGNTAVAAQVEIPLERFFGQVVLMKAFQE